MPDIIITESMLNSLKGQLSDHMSSKRFRHVVEVEKMAIYLGELYAPDKIPLLRAAALLHDITKERSYEEQVELCEKYGIELDPDARFAPKILHAQTAAAMIPDRFPEFADEELISCVRYHTTGRANMTLTENLLYLADYIDLSRTYPDCARMRNYFLSKSPDTLSKEDREEHLIQTLLMAYSVTIRTLINEGKLVHRDTLAARNHLVKELYLRGEK